MARGHGIRRGDAQDAMDAARSAVILRIGHDQVPLMARALVAFADVGNDITEAERETCKLLAATLNHSIPPSMRPRLQ